MEAEQMDALVFKGGGMDATRGGRNLAVYDGLCLTPISTPRCRR